MDALYLWVMGGLLLVSFAILFLPVAPGTIELMPTELGYLRRGSTGAVRTALAALLSEGVIMVRSRGGVRRTDKPLRRCRDPFQRAVYDTLHGPAGLSDLAARPVVRRARARLVERLADAVLVPGRLRLAIGLAGLISVAAVAIVGADSGTGAAVASATVLIALCLALLSRRTIAGHRLLRAMRRERARLLAEPPSGLSRPVVAVGSGSVAVALGGIAYTEKCVDELGINLALGFEAVDFGGGGLDGGGFDGGGGGGGGGGGF